MGFDAFDELNPVKAFVFINDHDSKPLYYQMEAESQEPFKGIPGNHAQRVQGEGDETEVIYYRALRIFIVSYYKRGKEDKLFPEALIMI